MSDASIWLSRRGCRRLIGVVEGGDDVKTLAPLFRALDALKESVGWGKDGMM